MYILQRLGEGSNPSGFTRQTEYMGAGHKPLWIARQQNVSTDASSRPSPCREIYPYPNDVPDKRQLPMA